MPPLWSFRVRNSTHKKAIPPRQFFLQGGFKWLEHSNGLRFCIDRFQEIMVKKMERFCVNHSLVDYFNWILQSLCFLRMTPVQVGSIILRLRAPPSVLHASFTIAILRFFRIPPRHPDGAKRLKDPVFKKQQYITTTLDSSLRSE